MKGKRFAGGKGAGWGGGGQAEGDETHLYAEEGFRERENFRGISSSSTFALLSWRFHLRLKEKQRPPSVVSSHEKERSCQKVLNYALFCVFFLNVQTKCTLIKAM